MIADVTAIILTIVMFLVGLVFAPDRGRCPDGWWLSHGVSPSGVYRCAAPLDLGCEDDRDHTKWRPCPEPAHYDARVVCTGGAMPIVVDANVVGCQRGARW